MAEQQFYVGVHGVIANRGLLLVLRRAPAMCYRPGAWDLPGGHMALGENSEQCLLREVKEETALDVTIERLLGIHSMVTEPYLQALYACRLTVYRPIALRPNEHVEHRWSTMADLGGLELIPYLGSALRSGLLDHLK